MAKNLPNMGLLSFALIPALIALCPIRGIMEYPWLATEYYLWLHLHLGGLARRSKLLAAASDFTKRSSSSFLLIFIS